MPSLKKLPRDELNDRAERVGVVDPVHLPNRRAVIEAIEAKQKEFEGVSPALFKRGARVLNVYRSRTVIELSTALASFLFERPLEDSAPMTTVEAVQADLALIRSRDPRVADGAIAAGAVRMAVEIDDPYTSATAKSMCMKALQGAMDRLLELSPPGQEEQGKLHDLKKARAARRRAA